MLKNIFYILLDFFLIGKIQLLSLFNKIPTSWSYGEKGEVVIVQGFGETWYFFKEVGDYLNDKGYKIYVVQKLDYNTYPMNYCFNCLEEFVKDRNLKNFLLIGHSKGGKIVKHFLDNSRFGKNVLKCITIATPFHGTLLAKIRFGNLSEATPDSEFIQNLTKVKTNNYKVLNLYPKLDNLIIPNSSLMLEGAKNVQIGVVGHARILESKDTLKEIETFLSN